MAVFAVVAVLAQAQNDAISKYFNTYADDERFTSVYISPKMFQMVSKIDANDPEWNKIRPIINDLSGLRVLVGENMDGRPLYKEAISKIGTGEYSELLSVRDKDENVKMWIKDSGDIVHELFLLVGSSTEFVMLSFTGKIDLNRISELSNTLNIQGTEHLSKIKSKQ